MKAHIRLMQALADIEADKRGLRRYSVKLGNGPSPLAPLPVIRKSPLRTLVAPKERVIVQVCFGDYATVCELMRSRRESQVSC